MSKIKIIIPDNNLKVTIVGDLSDDNSLRVVIPGGDVVVIDNVTKISIRY